MWMSIFGDHLSIVLLLSPWCGQGFQLKLAVTEEWATVVVNDCPNLF